MKVLCTPLDRVHKQSSPHVADTCLEGKGSRALDHLLHMYQQGMMLLMLR